MAKAAILETVETTAVKGEVTITGIDIKFGAMVKLAMKALFAVLIAGVTIGILSIPTILFIMAVIAANGAN